MKLLIIAALLTLVSCVEANNEAVRKYRIYTPDRGAIYCKGMYNSTVTLEDCISSSGIRVKAIYNATNVTEEEE